MSDIHYRHHLLTASTNTILLAVLDATHIVDTLPLNVAHILILVRQYAVTAIA